MKLEMFVSVFVIAFTVVVMAFAVVFLVLEANDKLETLREKAPWFVKIAERRESLNVLFVVCLFMLLGNGYELVMKEIPEVPEPPHVTISPPHAPNIIFQNPSEHLETSFREPEDSLRRRTMKLADEWTDYITKRLADPNKPPSAMPNSANPNPSEEEKRAIQKSQEFYRAVDRYYAEHFRPKFVGVIEEYKHIGVDTHYLENAFGQFTPYPVPEGIAWLAMIH